MGAAQDTEITLGTGKMLLLFFGLVAICAVFFGVGFSLGKNSSRSLVSTESNLNTTAVQQVARPSGGKSASPSNTAVADEYRPVDAKASDTSVKAAKETEESKEAAAQEPASPAAAQANGPAYFVQVAAV